MTQMSKTKINWMKASMIRTFKNNLKTGNLSREWRYIHNHPKELIIGDPVQGVRTRSYLRHMTNLAFISQIEPKNIKEAENDPN